MSFEKNYEARDKIIDIIEKDLEGPVLENEIICGEWPLDYYILGKLYPQGFSVNETEKSPSEDVGDIDDDAGVSLSNSRNPSSFGISFSLSEQAKHIFIKTKAAKYSLMQKEEIIEKLNLNEMDIGKCAKYWERDSLNLQRVEFDVSTLTPGKAKEILLCEKLELVVLLHKKYSDGSKTVTVSMVNGYRASDDYSKNNLRTFFQPSIEITARESKAFEDVRRNVHFNDDREIAEMELLYRNVGNYASGHGCAVNWDMDESNNPVRLYTLFLPISEVLQMMPSIEFDEEVLGMKYLAYSVKEDVIKGLYNLTKCYKNWIKKNKKEIVNLPDEYVDAAERNMSKCDFTHDTINKSIDALSDDLVYKAFALANRAMFDQRKQMLKNNQKYKSDADIKWYPFQLAFFLQEIVSFAMPDSEERKKVDLLWFPTGGGKTEAYLGIAAFVIFLRRLRYKNRGSGVTVLMRYTLRLLTFQQFERASALVCACELIRRKEKIEGGEIGIGLWVGIDLTPNKIISAKKILDGEKEDETTNSNPVQIGKCPWCGKRITEKEYECDVTNKRMRIHCSNPKCEFNAGLPIYLVDEEIYEHMPTFIVATVDKFAQVAFNYETSALFGKSKGRFPPDLVIQDELHLISGPLGTITGLYESAFRKLCEYDGHYPKVVASTATIKNADEQIKALYASKHSQFPPQGIDINDSFFAVLSSKKIKPARTYLGCMAIGTSPTTMMIRVMAALLFGSRYLMEAGYDDKVVDSFWTITSYFNTLRELGGAIVRVVDDIQDRYNYLRYSKFKNIYELRKAKLRYDTYKELTSREKSEDIGKLIQDGLKVEYKSDGTTLPYDFLLSSNMISVGVDVGRLGTMIVVGQPKTTSEYIQATSRVGREMPGLVVATYNQAKSRDRSHYESFTQYHETFYRYVEATSITPFSDRARDRALQAVYVILCRNLISELSDNHDAVNFSRDIPELKKIRDYILEYVKRVDPEEYAHVENDIDEIERTWEEKSSRRDELKYRAGKYEDLDKSLFAPDYVENSRFRVMNTMRNVETTVQVFINEKRKD